MRDNKQSIITSWLVVLLLTAQVRLSSFVIIKLRAILFILSPTGSGEVLPNQYVKDVSIDDDPKQGVDGAPVIVVEFADYQCPYCAEADKNIKTVLEKYKGKILFVYRDFPLENSHPNALLAAEAANCAGEQGKYWEMHDVLYLNQAQLEPLYLKEYATQLGLDTGIYNECLDNHEFVNEVRHDMEDARKYQVAATPTFFVNGFRLEGGNLEQLIQYIENILNNSSK